MSEIKTAKSIKETTRDHLRSWDKNLANLMKASSGDSPITNIFIDDLIDNPYNKDREISQDSIDAMVASILSEGLMQPIIVTKTEDGKYRKISGHLRTKAISEIFKQNKTYKFAGKTMYNTVPCIIKEYDSDIMEQIAVLAGNVRNDDSKKEKIRRTIEAHKLYLMCIEKGIKIVNKLDWLSSVTGYPRRSLIRYLNEGSLEEKGLEVPIGTAKKDSAIVCDTQVPTGTANLGKSLIALGFTLIDINQDREKWIKGSSEELAITIIKFFFEDKVCLIDAPNHQHTFISPKLNKAIGARMKELKW